MRNMIAILVGCTAYLVFTSVGFSEDDFSTPAAKESSAKARKLIAEKNQDAVEEMDKLLFGDLDEAEAEMKPLPTKPRLQKTGIVKKMPAKGRTGSSVVQGDFHSSGRTPSKVIQVSGKGNGSEITIPDDSSEESPLILMLPDQNDQPEVDSDVLTIEEKAEKTEKIMDLTEETPLLEGPSNTETSTHNASVAGTGVQTPTVSLEWVKRSAVNVGQKCECELLVKNMGKSTVSNVDVDAFFPRAMRIVGVNPKPIDNQDHLTWKYQTLEPGEERKIQVQMIPATKGNLATTAYVRFSGAASESFEVREPKLVLNVKGPESAIVGELASQLIVISNQGDGVATDVVIQALIPEGLLHARGKKLTLEIGSLEPGETRNVRLSLEAVAGGDQKIEVKAKANAVPVETASANVSVIAPHLQVAVEGPGLRYVGRKAQYNIQVANDGQGVSNNVRLVYNVPEGYEFVRADRGGKFDDVSNSVQWFIGRLGAEEARQVRIELTAKTPGDYVHQIAALSENGNRVEKELKSSIEGTASLVLEIIDLDDPVEVGSETAYEVRVKNEGSAVAQNVVLGCEIPEGLSLVEAKGPSRFTVNNAVVSFSSLPALEPGKTAIYRVHVKGIDPGNKHFRVNLASDSIDEPLVFEELTKFYKE